MSNPVLDGLKVLDLSQNIAGAYCAKLLAEMGAEVIKVERPGVGDPTRHIGPFPLREPLDGGDVTWPPQDQPFDLAQDEPHETANNEQDPEASGTFLYLNTAKKGITLNLESPRGQDLLRALARTSDIVVESHTPDLMEGWKLDYAHLSEINPGLIMTSVTPFGQTGPYRHYKASDINCFAFGGLMSIFGDADRPPTKVYEGIIQYWAGGHAFTGTMAAVLCRELTGEGQQVDVSIVETVANHINMNYLQHLYKGEYSQRSGNTSAALGGAPSLYRAADGYMQAMLRPFEALADLITAPELLHDPRFSSPIERRSHGAELGEIIQGFMETRPKEDIFKESQKRRLPWAPLNTTADLFDSDHLRNENFFKEIEHPKTGTLLYPGSPFKIGDTEMVYYRAPLLGEHNDEIYCGVLGLSEEQLAKLKEEEVI